MSRRVPPPVPEMTAEEKRAELVAEAAQLVELGPFGEAVVPLDRMVGRRSHSCVPAAIRIAEIKRALARLS